MDVFEIAICDDDAAFAEAFRALAGEVLDARGAQHRVTTFADPEALMEAIESGARFDLIFQDVLFGAERGIRFAKRLNEQRRGVDVIFVTSSPDYALEGYDAHPLHYLLKPVSRERLEEALDRFLERHTSQRLRIATARGVLQVPVAEILYFEIFDHQVVLHRTGGGCESFSGALKDVEATLPQRCFVRLHRSYLVNLTHATQIVRYRMRLSSGEILPISKGLYPRVQRSLIEYADRAFPAF